MIKVRKEKEMKGTEGRYALLWLWFVWGENCLRRTINGWHVVGQRPDTRKASGGEQRLGRRMLAERKFNGLPTPNSSSHSASLDERCGCKGQSDQLIVGAEDEG